MEMENTKVMQIHEATLTSADDVEIKVQKDELLEIIRLGEPGARNSDGQKSIHVRLQDFGGHEGI